MIAEFSPLLGRGVVYTDDEEYIIQVRTMYQPEVAGNTHLGMWMQGIWDIQDMEEPGEYPFTVVYDRMKEAHDEAVKKLLEAEAS